MSGVNLIQISVYVNAVHTEQCSLRCHLILLTNKDISNAVEVLPMHSPFSLLSPSWLITASKMHNIRQRCMYRLFCCHSNNDIWSTKHSSRLCFEWDETIMEEIVLHDTYSDNGFRTIPFVSYNEICSG